MTSHPPAPPRKPSRPASGADAPARARAPRGNQSSAQAQPASGKAPAKAGLHPRNRHQGHYDFPALIRACPELGQFVIRNPYGKQSIDFASPEAVRVLNRALLGQQYGIRFWDIPAGYLCPPVPGRADYLHGLADLLATDRAGSIPRGAGIRALDIGCGANCIYPLLGQVEYGWRFTGADIDAVALAAAGAILKANGLDNSIELRRQSEPKQVFRGILAAGEWFDITLCNPPFHSSAAEAASGSQRKWRNLGKLDPGRKLPQLNFGGQSNELHCEGGELAFVRRMIADSQAFASQVGWFSCLISKGGNLQQLQQALAKAGAREVRSVPMGQGQKQSRFLAWSFLDQAARSAARP